MKPRLLLVHTIPPLIQVFNQLGKRLLPEADLVHILDEPVLAWIRQRGGLEGTAVSRLEEHIQWAGKLGARAALVTCSTLSPAVDLLKVSLPVYKIDQAMIEQAVREGHTIGILATAQSTLEPTRLSLEREANKQEKTVITHMVLVNHAFDAFLAGDWQTHDRLVWEAIRALDPTVDLVMLAQASMARALETPPKVELAFPVLTSPQAALERVRDDLFTGSVEQADSLPYGDKGG